MSCLTYRESGFNQLQLGILSTWGDILSRLALAHDLIIELSIVDGDKCSNFMIPHGGWWPVGMSNLSNLQTAIHQNNMVYHHLPYQHVFGKFRGYTLFLGKTKRRSLDIDTPSSTMIPPSFCWGNQYIVGHPIGFSWFLSLLLWWKTWDVSINFLTFSFSMENCEFPWIHINVYILVMPPLKNNHIST